MNYHDLSDSDKEWVWVIAMIAVMMVIALVGEGCR